MANVINYTDKDNFDYDDNSTIVRGGKAIYNWQPEWNQYKGGATGSQSTTPAAPTYAAPTSQPSNNPYGDSAEGAWNRYVRSNYGENAWGTGSGNMNQYRGNLDPIVAAFNAAHPGSNARVAGIDKIDFGQGAIDVLTNGGQFTYGAPGRPGYGAPVNGGGGNGFGGSGSGSLTGGGNNGELYNLLMNRIRKGEGTDANDPIIKGQVDAYRAEQERAKRNYLSDAAEKGGPLVNLNGEQRLAAERTGQNVSGFQAQLLGRELQSQRDQIMNYIKEAGDLLTDQEKMSLQLQLAEIDDATKRYGINENARQFNNDLGLKAWDRQNYWDFQNSPMNG